MNTSFISNLHEIRNERDFRKHGLHKLRNHIFENKGCTNCETARLKARVTQIVLLFSKLCCIVSWLLIHSAIVSVLPNGRCLMAADATYILFQTLKCQALKHALPCYLIYASSEYKSSQWRSELTNPSNAVRIISTMVKTSYTRILRKLAIALT